MNEKTIEQVKEFFDAHWTVREYTSEKIPPQKLDVILHAAQRAPTDATAQMYSFVRLVDPVLRKKIAALSGNPHIETAAEAFIVCADVRRLKSILVEGGFEPAQIPHISIHFGIGDAVMAAQNMLIAAEMLGYRGCWIGGIISALDQISDLISLPEDVFPFAGLTIGVAAEPQQSRPRISRQLVVHENTYREPTSDELKTAIKDMAAITSRGNWAATLARYFGKSGTMEAREVSLKNFLQRKLGL